MRDLEKYGVGGALFLLPFFVNPFTYSFDMMLRPPKLFAAFLLGNILLSVYLARRVHLSIGIGTFCFALTCLLTGFGGIQIYPYAYLLSGIFIALWFVGQPLKTQEFYFKCITVSGSALSLYAFLQMADLDPIFNYAPGIDRTNPIAFMGQTTIFGAYISIVAVVALATRDWTSFVLCSAAAIGTASSFTYAALAAGIYINMRWIVRGKKKLIYIPVAAILCIIVAYLLNPNAVYLMDNGRFEAWRETWNAIVTGPILTGYGPGSFQVLFPKHFQKAGLEYGYFIQAHNDYLQAFFELGLIGVFAIAYLYVSLLKQYFLYWWKKIRLEVTERAALAGLAAISVNAVGNFPFQLCPHYILGIIFIFQILRIGRNDGRELTFHP